MITRVNLTSGKLEAQEWEEGTSQFPDNFPKKGLEKDEGKKRLVMHLFSCQEKLCTPLRLSTRDLHKLD